MRIAVVGIGISGLACAWLLRQRYDVTVYEAEPGLGGHSNTVDLSWRGEAVPVDTGFIVYNERNYPNLTRLFGHLGVPTQPNDMSFAVSLHRGRFEDAGSSIGCLFAHRSDLARPQYWGMLRDLLRFDREARAFLAGDARDGLTPAAFLEARGYGVSDQRSASDVKLTRWWPIGSRSRNARKEPGARLGCPGRALAS
jgi:uncharacterized protein